MDTMTAAGHCHRRRRRPQRHARRRRRHRGCPAEPEVRRRHGKTDVVDAIAAGRAVLSGQATATPKTADGPVEGLRALKVVQRSANKACTQALNQLRALVATALAELRERLRHLTSKDLVATCADFRVRADDDSLPAILRLSMRELAQRVQQLAPVREQLRAGRCPVAVVDQTRSCRARPP